MLKSCILCHLANVENKRQQISGYCRPWLGYVLCWVPSSLILYQKLLSRGELVMCNFKLRSVLVYVVVLVSEKPKPEKLLVAKLERRQFTYTRQQWTGKSPKQFLIDWTRKNLPKTASLSFERVEAGGGWWRARCDRLAYFLGFFCND